MIDKIREINRVNNFLLSYCKEKEPFQSSPYFSALVVGTLYLDDYIGSLQSPDDTVYLRIKDYYELLQKNRKPQFDEIICNNNMEGLKRKIKELPSRCQKILSYDRSFREFFPAIEAKDSKIVKKERIKFKNILPIRGKEEYKGINFYNRELFEETLEKIRKSHYRKIDVEKLWNLAVDPPYLRRLREGIIKGGYLIDDEKIFKECMTNENLWRMYADKMYDYAISKYIEPQIREFVKRMIALYKKEKLEEFIEIYSTSVEGMYEVMERVLKENKVELISNYYEIYGWNLGKVYFDYKKEKGEVYDLERTLRKNSGKFVEEFITVVDIWIENDKGDYLIEKIWDSDELFFYIFTYNLIISLSLYDKYSK